MFHLRSPIDTWLAVVFRTSQDRIAAFGTETLNASTRQYTASATIDHVCSTALTDSLIH